MGSNAKKAMVQRMGAMDDSPSPPRAKARASRGGGRDAAAGRGGGGSGKKVWMINGQPPAARGMAAERASRSTTAFQATTAVKAMEVARAEQNAAYKKRGVESKGSDGVVPEVTPSKRVKREVTPSKRVKREAAAVLDTEQPAAAVGAAAAEAEDVKPDLKRITASKEKPTTPRGKKNKAEATEAAAPSPITPSPMQAKKRSAVKKEKGVKGVKKETAAASPATPGMSSTYPTFRRPSPEEAQAACMALVEMYGKPTAVKLEAQGTLLERSSTRRTVLDSLVGTILSQNTTDVNSHRAFASLKAKFPQWADVLAADPAEVVEAIRSGGLAETKTTRIQDILALLLQERGELSLEYLHGMDDVAAKAELMRFKGVGPKTVACVLMFTLARAEFPVDAHVWKMALSLGWVPSKADRETTYQHLNAVLPAQLKFDLHVLMVRYGKEYKNDVGALRSAMKLLVARGAAADWGSSPTKEEC